MRFKTGIVGAFIRASFCLSVGIPMSVIAIVGMLNANINPTVIVMLIIGIICCLLPFAVCYDSRESFTTFLTLCCTRKQSLQNEHYSYWCYDISDQHIKCCIMNKAASNKIPSICYNLGHIDSVGSVTHKAEENSCASQYMIEKSLRVKPYTFGMTGDIFCAVLSSKIEKITTFGLNSVQLEYQKTMFDIFSGCDYNCNHSGNHTITKIPILMVLLWI